MWCSNNYHYEAISIYKRLHVLDICLRSTEGWEGFICKGWGCYACALAALGGVGRMSEGQLFAVRRDRSNHSHWTHRSALFGLCGMACSPTQLCTHTLPSSPMCSPCSRCWEIFITSYLSLPHTHLPQMAVCHHTGSVT